MDCFAETAKIEEETVQRQLDLKKTRVLAQAEEKKAKIGAQKDIQMGRDRIKMEYKLKKEQMKMEFELRRLGQFTPHSSSHCIQIWQSQALALAQWARSFLHQASPHRMHLCPTTLHLLCHRHQYILKAIQLHPIPPRVVPIALRQIQHPSHRVFPMKPCSTVILAHQRPQDHCQLKEGNSTLPSSTMIPV
jgi:hypothetical protein